ncbi:MAG: imidazole glycerol phosphate synthase subunit HisH [Bdellovibrionales bacterium]|nr:imidazole glycerol phosphate synthase subunit HisH [Bdellovibrionales bacterium]
MNIGVVDYGMGNLHSVAKALATTGASVRVSSDKATLSASDALVLPGVGAFGAAMNNLSKNGLDRFVREWLASGKPFLGICLGLQLLFDSSDESRGVRGLGVLKGRVRAFRKKDFSKKGYRVPHMGWNTVRIRQKEKLGVKASDSFYFVHTFFPEPKDKRVIWTTTPYGKAFCSAVVTGNITATQFHPEKSGDVGLRLLKNIVTKWERTA